MRSPSSTRSRCSICDVPTRRPGFMKARPASRSAPGAAALVMHFTQLGPVSTSQHRRDVAVVSPCAPPRVARADAGLDGQRPRAAGVRPARAARRAIAASRAAACTRDTTGAGTRPRPLRRCRRARTRSSPRPWSPDSGLRPDCDLDLVHVSILRPTADIRGRPPPADLRCRRRAGESTSADRGRSDETGRVSLVDAARPDELLATSDTAGLAALVRRFEPRHPRWVWVDTRSLYPQLLAAGVRVERCHDLRLCGAILASPRPPPRPRSASEAGRTGCRRAQRGGSPTRRPHPWRPSRARRRSSTSTNRTRAGRRARHSRRRRMPPGRPSRRSPPSTSDSWPSCAGAPRRARCACCSQRSRPARSSAPSCTPPASRGIVRCTSACSSPSSARSRHRGASRSAWRSSPPWSARSSPRPR